MTFLFASVTLELQHAAMLTRISSQDCDSRKIIAKLDIKAGSNYLSLHSLTSRDPEF